MENLFSVDSDAILRKYDMKGSTYSRKVYKDDYSVVSVDQKIKPILKDLDFAEIDHYLDCLEPEQKLRVTESIKRDVEFFRRNHIIDYSLILAVVRRDLCDPVTF